MQIYRKPELNIEVFDVDDVITISAGVIVPGSTTTTAADETSTTDPIIGPTGPDIDDADDWATAPMGSFDSPDIMGAPNPIQQSELPFDTEVWGGNPIQEGLNALYENVLEHF